MKSTCDLCSTDVTNSPKLKPADRNKIVDGKIKFGSWAWMCVPCHSILGIGIGGGRGQLFDVTTGKKLEG